MSDFDKEAEREKLRKQFEEDKTKRENTERMSELLLQGATMTNSHCDTCGDPIFRYEGQEFCPSCQVQVADDGETTQATTEQQQTQQSPDTASSSQPETASSSQSDATNIEIGSEGSESAEANASGATAVDPESRDESPAPSKSSESEPRSEPKPETEPQPESLVRSEPSSQSLTDLSEARQSLVRTVTRFAKQAETADDLEHVRKFLATTEDAAEALEALKRAEK
jgi:uncharacterized Zn finger protein (UPF0148 family)